MYNVHHLMKENPVRSNTEKAKNQNKKNQKQSSRIHPKKDVEEEHASM